MSLSTAVAAHTSTEWAAHATRAEDQAMRYVAYGTHPASSEATRVQAEYDALTEALRAGMYRSMARGEVGRAALIRSVIID